MFYNLDDSVLFYDGFHGRKSLTENMRWMSPKKATLFTQNLDNCASKIKIYVKNPCISIVGQHAPESIEIKIEHQDAIKRELKHSEEYIELEIQREHCKNDGILEVILNINCLWNPMNAGLSNNNRDLGLLIQSVEMG